MIIHKNGDILSSTANIICQQVNCQGVMGSGLAKQIRAEFPCVYDYYKYYCEKDNKAPSQLLGDICFVYTTHGNERAFKNGNAKTIIFANIFGQILYGIDAVQTYYPALQTGLYKVYQYAKEHNYSVAIPYKIGCGLAGGDWDIVYKGIEDIFKDGNINCEIWRLN